MSDAPLDPRSVCNLILDETDSYGMPFTHIALQKVLYFAHASYLNQTKRPLVSGYFEAWKYGPVHPGVYKAFKSAGDRPITFRAERQDLLTGEKQCIPAPAAADVRRHIRKIALSYGELSASQLVELSHAKSGPWHWTVEQAQTALAFGMRITDDAILERFKYHKVSLRNDPNPEEATQDTPFA